MSPGESDKTNPNLDFDQTIGPEDAARSSAGKGDADRTLGPDATMGPTGRPRAADTGHDETIFAGGARRPVSERITNIEGYEILDELGRGGMGVVYKARDKALNRIVALKMILAGAHASDEAIARFKIEAEAVAQLKHRGIVQVYDVGLADGQPYCALEFIDGGGLDELMTHEKLSIAESVAIVEELASAMSSAHQAGIVHRDLKPANVLISTAGSSSASSINVESLGQYRPRITDFGLAKNVEQDSHQTQTGAIMGTPGYMAPEQARGVKRIGPAADIYSLGAILYHLVTGKPPFIGETPIKTIMQVINDPAVSPRSISTTVDRDLDTIILKCLEKEPGARYASAEHLAQDLHRYQAGMPIEARPVSGVERLGKWIRRKPWAAAMIGLTGLGIIGVIIGGAVFNSQLSAANREIEKERTVAVEALAETSRALEAESKALEAESAALENTDAALKRAEASEAQSRRRLIDNFVNNGMQAMNDNQMLQALPWLSEALALEKDPVRQPIHQLRFNLAVQAAPKPERTWLTDAAVVGCAISDDGKQVVSVNADRRIKIYDIQSHEVLHEVDSHGQITGFDISGDQRQAVILSVHVNVASGDFSTSIFEAQLWDIQQGKLLPPFQIPSREYLTLQPQVCAEKGWFVNLNQETGKLELIDLSRLEIVREFSLASVDSDVRIDKRGQFIGSLDDKKLTVWNTNDSQTPLLEVDLDDPKTRSARFKFEPQNRLVLISDKIRIFDLPSAKTIGEFPRETAAIPQVAVGPGETGFALAWPNGQLEIYGFDGTPINHAGVGSQVVRLFYSTDGRHLLVATNLEVLKFDATYGGQIGSPIPATLKPLRLADFHAESGMLAIGSGSGTFMGNGCLRIWNVQDNGYKIPLQNSQTAERVDLIFPRADGHYVAMVTGGLQHLRFLDIRNRRRPKQILPTWQTGTEKKSASPDKTRIKTVVWSGDGQLVATAFDDNRVQIARFPSGQPIGECQLDSPQEMVFSSDGKQMAVCYGDGGKLVAVIDAGHGQVMQDGLKHKRRVRVIKFVNGNTQLATISNDLNYRLFDVGSGKQIEKENLRMAPQSAVFDGSGRLVAVGGERLGELPGRLSILDARSGKPIADPLDFESVVQHVRFSDDGKLLAMADAGGVVRIITTRDGRDRGLLITHPDLVLDMQFSHDNRMLLTVCQDRRTRLFDVNSFVPIAPASRIPSDPDSGIRGASFLGKTYDMIEHTETARIWHLEQRDFAIEQASTLSRFLTGSVISPQGTIVPTPSQSLKADFSNVTFGQIIDSDLFRHLIPR